MEGKGPQPWPGDAPAIGQYERQERLDIGLVIDAMDILHAGKVDGFVLVSSDSDFTRLASRIREDGLQVIGVGEKKTPESLRNVCNRFIFPETSPQGRKRRLMLLLAKPAKTEKDAPSKAIPLILAAMKKIGIEEDSYSLGQLGQILTQLYPDFDSRSYGSARPPGPSEAHRQVRGAEGRRQPSDCPRQGLRPQKIVASQSANCSAARPGAGLLFLGRTAA